MHPVNMTRLPAGEYLGRFLRRWRLSGLSLTVSVYPSRAMYPWHTHEHPTLFIPLAGVHRDQTRAAAVEQPPLSVVFHPSTAPHATSVGQGGLMGINLEITDEWLEHCQLRSRDVTVEFRLFDSIWTRFSALQLAAACRTGDAPETEAENVAMELTGCLVQSPPTGAPAPRWLARAEEYLRTHYREPVRLHNLAGELDIHPVYCCRAFRSGLGCTITAYIRLLRLIEAGRLALTEDQPLVDVAAHAGFADQAHFTRTLSRALGITPARLRRVRRKWYAEAGK
jgi:AraC family transcriptional regulator